MILLVSVIGPAVHALLLVFLSEDNYQGPTDGK